MKVADFDFLLPPDLIAERPLQDRDRSRLLVLHRDGMIEHKQFPDFSTYLNKGDMVLVNNTKVFPARLTGLKKSGGKIEILLVRQKEDHVWEVLSKGSYTGIVMISENLRADLFKGKIAYFHYTGDFYDLLWEYGSMPLPPYIKRLPEESDKERYQTIFASRQGSIAAPTAGLHFTNDAKERIIAKGILLRALTLHVGIGTFKPVGSTFVEDHSMDPEYFELDKTLIREINEVKSSGNKIISVGTTTTRAIEGYMSGMCQVTAHNGTLQGTTDIFIYPGYTFKVIDSLLTNFHLPRSTPLMLASAISNREALLHGYRHALAKRYRFLSYGDAMLIL